MDRWLREKPGMRRTRWARQQVAECARHLRLLHLVWSVEYGAVPDVTPQGIADEESHPVEPACLRVCYRPCGQLVNREPDC